MSNTPAGPAGPIPGMAGLPSDADFELALQRKTERVILVVDRIVDYFNLQGILRSADSFGIHQVWIMAGHRMKNISVAPGLAKGCEQWLDLRFFDSTEGLLAALRADGREVWATTLSTTAVPLHIPTHSTRAPSASAVDGVAVAAAGAPAPTGAGAGAVLLEVPPRLAVVMGREADGVSPEVVAASQRQVYIPMVGFSESFNVGVATGLVLHRVFALCPEARGSLPPDRKAAIRAQWFAHRGVLAASAAAAAAATDVTAAAAVLAPAAAVDGPDESKCREAAGKSREVTASAAPSGNAAPAGPQTAAARGLGRHAMHATMDHRTMAAEARQLLLGPSAASSASPSASSSTATGKGPLLELAEWMPSAIARAWALLRALQATAKADVAGPGPVIEPPPLPPVEAIDAAAAAVEASDSGGAGAGKAGGGGGSTGMSALAVANWMLLARFGRDVLEATQCVIPDAFVLPERRLHDALPRHDPAVSSAPTDGAAGRAAASPAPAVSAPIAFMQRVLAHPAVVSAASAAADGCPAVSAVGRARQSNSFYAHASGSAAAAAAATSPAAAMTDASAGDAAVVMDVYAENLAAASRLPIYIDVAMLRWLRDSPAGRVARVFRAACEGQCAALAVALNIAVRTHGFPTTSASSSSASSASSTSAVAAGKDASSSSSSVLQPFKPDGSYSLRLYLSRPTLNRWAQAELNRQREEARRAAGRDAQAHVSDRANKRKADGHLAAGPPAPPPPPPPPHAVDGAPRVVP